MTLDFCSLSWVNQVRNTRNVNRTGQPTGYKLIPGSNCLPLALPEAKFLRRAGFLKHNLWVTTYKNDEMFPGGEFPNQNPRIDEGLATWVKKDRSLEETNIVLWYLFCYLVMLIRVFVLLLNLKLHHATAGTFSGSPISQGWKTGPSCQWSGSASC